MPESRPSVIVTCGPSYEPIDEVRRMTNFSTGALGALLCRHLARAGARVTCLRGVGATDNTPIPAQVIPFSTNADLAEKLQALDQKSVDVIFHAAALCDFRVKPTPTSSSARKLSSRDGTLMLELEPLPKLIHHLRHWFPQARLVGWKYEMDGGVEQVLEAAKRQLAENQTDACVINGAAYGPGLGFLESDQPHWHFDDREALCEFLADWTFSARA